VNGNPGYVINGATHDLKWAYSGGFGQSLIAVDIDHDGRAEFISYMSVNNQTSLFAWHPDTLAVVWSIGNVNQDVLALGDYDGDGNPDLYSLPYGGPSITIRALGDGSVLKQLSGINGNSYVYASLAAVADFDGDGAPEIAMSSAISDRSIRIFD